MYSVSFDGRRDRSYFRSSSVGVACKASAALVAFGILKLNCECRERFGQLTLVGARASPPALSAKREDLACFARSADGDVRAPGYAFASARKLRRRITSTDSSPPSATALLIAFSAATF